MAADLADNAWVSAGEIAERLGVSVASVRTYLHRVYDKLHVTNRTEAVIKYLNVSSKG